MAGVSGSFEGLGRFRRVVAGLVATASVSASRYAADLLATASDLFDIGVSLFLLSQTVGGGSELVSSVLPYVLFGYLVYAYTPELYLGHFGDIVQDRGFRALTTVTALYFGLIFGRVLNAVPDVGPFAHIPVTVGGSVVSIVVGILVSVVAFSGYILLIKRERSRDRSGDLFETIDAFTMSPADEELDKIEALPQRRRQVTIAIGNSGVGVFYMIPACLLGVALPVMETFSPIPEGVVVLAVLGSYVPLGGRLSETLPDRANSDIEFQVADTITDALQNPKGLLLLIFILPAIATGGFLVVLSIPIMIQAGRFFVALGTEIVANHGELGSVSLSEWHVVAAELWFIVGLVTSWLAYSLYTLWYWVRQLQRLPAYATFWEAYWQGEFRSLPAASVTRPPGLYLPGAALFLGLTAVVSVASDGGSFRVWVGWGLVWPVLVGIAVWSVRAGSRRSPQPLRGEGRAVGVAFALLFGSPGVIVVINNQLSPWVLLGLLSLIFGLTYLPEVTIYSDRRQGAASYVDLLYYTGYLTVGLLLVESFGSVPLVLYILLAGLWLLLLMGRILRLS